MRRIDRLIIRAYNAFWVINHYSRWLPDSLRMRVEVEYDALKELTK
jgi:hypothetical protein